MPDPSERERLVAGLLDRWPWEHGGVVVGGYAVAAYGAPRYSDDIDIVVPVAALGPLASWVRGEGFAPERVPADLEQNYAGRMARWRRGDVALDLIPGVVRDREALVDIPEAWIAKRHLRLRLVLIDASTRSEIPVARLEAFWALKLQAGRLRDLADLFAVHEAAVDLDEVRSLFQGLWCGSLASKLQRVRARLEDEKVYADALSRMGRGSPGLPANRKAWAAFSRMVGRAIPPPNRG